MTNKEAQEVLDELDGVRPEMLNDKGRRLFEAIMQIADERDELKEHIKNINKRNSNQRTQNDLLHKQIEKYQNEYNIQLGFVEKDYILKSKIREYLVKMEKRCNKPKFSVMKKEIEELLQEGDKMNKEQKIKILTEKEKLFIKPYIERWLEGDK